MPTLIWKEWHEQRWKLGFSCVVLAALALIGLRARMIADETMVMFVCSCAISLLPVLSSTGLVPAERSDGTLESLLSLPVAPWRILAAKTLIGLLLCVGPIVAAAAVSVPEAGGRELPTAAILALYGRTALVTVTLFLWMLALTVRLPNEARAGLVALGIFFIWGLATGGLADSKEPLLGLGVALSPLGFLVSGRLRPLPPLLLVAIVQVLLIAPLWLLAARQLTAGAEDKQ